ncbi:MAG TPA: response regulator [Pyrinomonadaceae bacterium]|nr:response regulator [Pyrinomonadaceae bacterium]
MAASALQVNGRPRVLFCDDAEDLVAHLRLFFRGAAFDAEFVTDGETLARRGADERWDLIVTDLAMSPVDGWTAVERIREVSQVPVWALSAHVKRDMMNRVRAKELDVLLLEKPDDTMTLRERIENFFAGVA